MSSLCDSVRYYEWDWQPGHGGISIISGTEEITSIKIGELKCGFDLFNLVWFRSMDFKFPLITGLAAIL
jgi:hypothetical protein